MALTIIRKETAIIEKDGHDVLWFSSRLPAEPSDSSIHLQKIGRSSEKRHFLVIADQDTGDMAREVAEADKLARRVIQSPRRRES
jgi:hypothetical protein